MGLQIAFGRSRRGYLMGFWDVVSGTIAHWNKTKRLANDKLFPRYRCLGPLIFGLTPEDKVLSDELRYFLITYQSCFQTGMSNFLFQEGEQQALYRKLVQVITPFKLNELNGAFHFHYIGLCSRESDKESLVQITTLMMRGALFVYDKPHSYAHDWLAAARAIDGSYDDYMIKLREEVTVILKQGEYNTYETEGLSMIGLAVPIAETSQHVRWNENFRKAVREEILL